MVSIQVTEIEAARVGQTAASNGSLARVLQQCDILKNLLEIMEALVKLPDAA